MAKDEENGLSWSPDDSQLVFFDVYWRRGAGKGTGKGSIQLPTLASGSRQTISSAGVAQYGSGALRS